MTETEVSANLLRALEQVVGLPARDVDNIRVLINAGEWAVALETMCTQIHEYDVDVNTVVRDQLLRLGDQLGVAAGYLLGEPWEGPGG